MLAPLSLPGPLKPVVRWHAVLNQHFTRGQPQNASDAISLLKNNCAALSPFGQVAREK
jgi:hypothetical protein